MKKAGLGALSTHCFFFFSIYSSIHDLENVKLRQDLHWDSDAVLKKIICLV